MITQYRLISIHDRQALLCEIRAQENCVFGNYIRKYIGAIYEINYTSNYRERTGRSSRSGKIIVRGASGELKSIWLPVRRRAAISRLVENTGNHDCGTDKTFPVRHEDSGASTTATSGGGTTGVIPRNEHIQLRFSLNFRKKSARPTQANFSVASLVVQPRFSLSFFYFFFFLFFFFLLSFS